jgi:hypothetical protein
VIDPNKVFGVHEKGFLSLLLHRMSSREKRKNSRKS